MTLLQAISTGRLYTRYGGVWMKSEKLAWPIRHTETGAPVPISEQDVQADDWVIDIRMTNHGDSWIFSYRYWEDNVK